ncbi:uncharacterized protein J4E87_010797 [Alternaria ethzedia]|uniref:uncharacterized protein n=1 Tax=Alternaria ethzedia TaxID=181014 RepID=UPI0020C4F4D5|nr:uncharacterized protein J4E87_010797 [Alternaria ethzedia]KAI4610543.1 hypothetical protein J4E87_010797 [Alternaria ethzedia]
MSRIVQDSDEESDGDLEGDLPPPKQADASGQPLSNDTHGTGSTGRAEFTASCHQTELTCSPESLKRAIEKAHRNHLQSQPSQEEPQSSVSLPEHPNKKRKTTADPSPLKPFNDVSAKKGPVTYGKAPKSIFGSSPSFNAPPVGRADATLESTQEVPWLPEGTMRDNYALHEPAMFPEPSSTVPNATMTQQHILDVVNAPLTIGQEIDSEQPRYIPPPEPSIPWSDLMKFTPADATEQTESSDRDPPSNDPPSATPVRTSQGGYEYSASQRSRRGSGGPLKGSPLRNELSRNGAGDADRKATPVEASSADIWDIPSTAPQKTPRGEHKVVKTTPRRSKSAQVPVASSDDDLANIGLPKEQYKPRPSRSRSLKVEEEQPIDYSVRPEKAKNVSKRRQTTATADTSNPTTPEKVRQICDMGFTPSTTSGALKKNNGDVIQAIDWLVTNNVGHDELAPPSPPKTKPVMNKSDETPAMDSEAIQDIMRSLDQYQRDDTQAVAQNVVHVAVANDAILPEPIDLTETPTSDLRSPTKVQVVIPKKSPLAVSKQPPSSTTASNKKAKRKKPTSNPAESEPAETDSTVPEIAPAKKKARGRPKKVAPVASPKEPDPEPLEQAVEVEHQQEVVQTTEPGSNPEEIEQDSKLTRNDTDDGKSPDATDTTTASHSKPPAKPSPAAASETPERKIKPTTASPANTGKVPYRVGLSKRARIAPLLRIVKK